MRGQLLLSASPRSRHGRMDDLIKKLEAATGPSRVLDVEIYPATIDEFAVPFKGQFIPGMVWRAFYQSYPVKQYNGSLYDALQIRRAHASTPLTHSTRIP